MKKIVILFLSTLFALACAKENQAPQEQAEGHKVNLQEVTLTAVQEGLDTKTYFNKSTGELTWTSNESDMAIFDGSGLQAFSHVSTEEGGHQATFSGTADVNNPNWIAVHPAMNSSWENSKVYVTFPCFQNARNGGGMLANMNTMAAKVTHNAGVLDDFTMKNVGGLIKLTVTDKKRYKSFYYQWDPDQIIEIAGIKFRMCRKMWNEPHAILDGCSHTYYIDIDDMELLEEIKKLNDERVAAKERKKKEEFPEKIEGAKKECLEMIEELTQWANGDFAFTDDAIRRISHAYLDICCLLVHDEK